jgi:hypothetical protein
MLQSLSSVFDLEPALASPPKDNTSQLPPQRYQFDQDVDAWLLQTVAATQALVL